MLEGKILIQTTSTDNKYVALIFSLLSCKTQEQPPQHNKKYSFVILYFPKHSKKTTDRANTHLWWQPLTPPFLFLTLSVPVLNPPSCELQTFPHHTFSYMALWHFDAGEKFCLCSTLSSHRDSLHYWADRSLTWQDSGLCFVVFLSQIHKYEILGSLQILISFEVFPFSVSLKIQDKSDVSKGIAIYPALDPHPRAPFQHTQKRPWGKSFEAEP